MKAATVWVALGVLAVGAVGQTTAPASSKAFGARVTTVDGSGFAARLLSLGKAKAVFDTPAGRRDIPCRDLLRIKFADPADAMDAPGQRLVVLAGGGGLLAIETLSVREAQMTVTSRLLGKATLPLAAVATVYLPRKDQLPAALKKLHRAIELPRANKDFLFAEDKKRTLIPLPGVLKSIAAGKVTFQVGAKDEAAPLASVRVLQLARVASQAGAPGGYLIGRDGSTVPFGSASLPAGKTTLAIGGGAVGADAADLSAVAEIHFLSDRCVYLSDLKPDKVNQAGLFDLYFPYRRDRSTAGRAIRLGGATYPKGLGLHSRCELTYAIGAAYASLSALAGIAPAGGKRGNALLKILGDGKDLIEPVKLLGGAAPTPVRCKLAGVKTLTVLVDFGDDGTDVGDHVNLAEARLIKP